MMDTPRSLQDMRVRALKLLLLERLTPLLRKEIQHAIAFHSEVTKSVDVDKSLQDADILYNRITSRWTKTHISLPSRALLVKDMILFQNFLADKLLEDYAMESLTKDSFITTPWVSSQAAIVERHATAQGDSNVDPNYHLRIVLPLEELMLDQNHVESKLLSTARSPGSHIQRLIDAEDWSALAVSLRNDRDLTTDLFKEDPWDMFKNGTKQEKIIRGINRIQNQYSMKMLHSHAPPHTHHRAAEGSTSSTRTLNTAAQPFGTSPCEQLFNLALPATCTIPYSDMNISRAMVGGRT
ncbi:hypothetical protein F4778DRAFT_560469 [Xylariomycetidae sp. FL2044]|nr:hypothetical protein F4778DRAFT_560469 [Xylariomycetidae sp. FL2044]